MSQKKLWIIGIQEEYLEIISKQVNVVFGDQISIDTLTVKDIRRNTIEPHHVVLISVHQIRGLVVPLIPEDCPIIVGKRDINYVNTTELLKLPPGQKILVVNDTKENTEETVLSLRKTFFEHEYIGYLPEEPIPNDIDYIVTAGESHLLPNSLPNVIDVGYRVLAYQTLETIQKLLSMDYDSTTLIPRYLKSCISVFENQNTKNINLNDARNRAQYSFEDVIAVSEEMKKSINLAKFYAIDRKVTTILIEGEHGTGKGMIAQAIHNYSEKSEMPFITMDCTQKDNDLLERELFGSEQNGELSYGVFELVTNGTVCIREIGSLSLTLQKRILTVLKEGRFNRVDGRIKIPLLSRVIVTVSSNVKTLVNQGVFLPELYEFLSLHNIMVPPLRERREDIIPFINNIKARLGRELHFNQEVMDYFLSYHWPENVRELYNTITYLSIKDEEIIGIESLPFYHHSDNSTERFISHQDVNSIIENIEKHGFLNESIEILKAFHEGKKNHVSFGRKALKQFLDEKGVELSEQQLRMRLEVLQKLGLTNVRQGRAGSTISRGGEEFLKALLEMESLSS